MGFIKINPVQVLLILVILPFIGTEFFRSREDKSYVVCDLFLIGSIIGLTLLLNYIDYRSRTEDMDVEDMILGKGKR